ncbi:MULTISPECIES: type VI secretion system ATPase TssH [Enterobacteriaceae]|uniref:type VI secretion system ATPase TssH n=2 Tax=Enterobacterales TaxID=91347 RepID=UPI000BE1B11B|nr:MULTISPECIES: type VI secretion system ATPase TssH [Enterobacteriaceae]EBB6210881.1 type VI secretion system ATPase TssH [Salmonella enterica]ECH8734421.1 type VI secretion system ATPase TssH [Salmonella enterica subsp. enterica serovar Wandsworth]EEJ2306304.1 type VI secretion system ATPase TssH [Salmonella enterica subsp. enterica]EDN8389308.1 type VI secretion system ATPase TssH [Salmonella enterica subsp. enterica serovar Wandsworth]EDS5038285.1 type VI secretion system ATPase TssH [Sal
MELKALINQLSEDALVCLNLAVNVAVEYGYSQVYPEHLLLAMKECQPQIFDQVYHYGVWLQETVLRDVMVKLTRHIQESDTAPVLSPLLVNWLEVSERYSREQWQDISVSPHVLLFTLISLPQLALQMTPEDPLPPAKNVLNALEQQLQKKSNDAHTESSYTLSGFAAIEQFTHNVTRAAASQSLDPIPEREQEIRQMIDILLRRRQNNPLLVGEPGVGKTALVEGLAQRIIAGEVPESLRNTEILTLDLGLLQAGASVKGGFEKRLQDVIKEVKARPTPVILFIDEAHMLIGAGGSAGQSDAANLLKPMLARGELRTIAATTWAEYKKYFEKDAALSRRFQPVVVGEPSLDAALSILRSVVANMENHHQVRILNEAVTDTITLADRYITGRQFPDKAVSLLDTACARVLTSQSAEPAEIETLRRQIIRHQRELRALRREDIQHERQEKLISQLDEWQQQLTEKLAHYQQQQALVKAIRHSDDSLEIQQLRARLKQNHQLHPYVFDCVDADCVADVVAGWTGVPAGHIKEDEKTLLMSLEERLGQRIFGQEHALHQIARQLRIARSRLADPVKPLGVFLLVGPSGVGKTETALVLAAELFGGEGKLITVNMSEYQEAHSVAGLKGAPPGYVGYGEGGTLTEAVRRQPYSVILLDEIEKAHPDVLEIFYQVFDKGEMEDAEGVKVNFRHSLIILTSNVASELIGQRTLAPAQPDAVTLTTEIIPVLQQYFMPAFIGRTQVLPYYAISSDMLDKIIYFKLNKIFQRYHIATGILLRCDPAVINYIAGCCAFSATGGRDIDNVLTREVLPILAESVLLNTCQETPARHLSVGNDGRIRLMAKSDETGE